MKKLRSGMLVVFALLAAATAARGASPRDEDALRKKLGALDAAHKAGILTDAEYARKKAEIEKQLAPPLDPVTQRKLAALKAALDAGVITRAEYDGKLEQLLGAAAVVTAPKRDLVTYRDERGRFALEHPRGWTATANPAFPMLRNGQVAGLVMVHAGVLPQMTSASLLDKLVGPMKTQFKDFREVRRGARTLSGHQAVEVVISGTDARLGAQRGHITALVAGGTSYVVMMSGPAAKVTALEREWEGILGSFKLGQSAGAAAIVFGIGGRDVAKRKLEEWVK